jgi:H+/Cl- antiporter ClcA
VLLVPAGVIGVLVSVLAYLFLAAVSKLQHWLYASLPGELGFHGMPSWWPFPLLAIGGVLVALAITYLPGTGGHEPADGLKVGGVVSAPELPGIVLAALATLGFGAVLGPEAPLIALGGGVAGWAVSRVVKGDKRPVTILAGAGSFAAISTLFGSPLLGAFLLMEAVGLGGATLELVLLPGLLAAGIGALVAVGMGQWTGLGAFSLAIPGLPHFSRPDIAEFGWALLIGLAGAVAAALIRRLAVAVRRPAKRQILIATPIAGLVVAGLAVLFSQVTGKTDSYVLFSGQNEVGPLIAHRLTIGVGALCLLLLCKGLAYSVSMSTFRGGPVFPSIFLGAAAGLALGHLPGLPFVAAMGMGIGAMLAAILRLPLTATLLATVLLFSDGLAITPLVIVAVVVSFISSHYLDKIGETPRAGESSDSSARVAGG